MTLKRRDDESLALQGLQEVSENERLVRADALLREEGLDDHLLVCLFTSPEEREDGGATSDVQLSFAMSDAEDDEDDTNHKSDDENSSEHRVFPPQKNGGSI